jgi:hypothetical protein
VDGGDRDFYGSPKSERSRNAIQQRFIRLRLRGSAMTRLRCIAAAVAIALSAFAGGAFAQGCVSGQEARQLIDQGQVVPFPEAASRAGLAANQVVDVQLCQAGGGYVYRVRLRDGGEANVPAS